MSLKYEPSSEPLHISEPPHHPSSCRSRWGSCRSIPNPPAPQTVVWCGLNPPPLPARALTCRLISLVGVKWSCLRINIQAFPPASSCRSKWGSCRSTQKTPRRSPTPSPLARRDTQDRGPSTEMLPWATPSCRGTLFSQQVTSPSPHTPLV